MLTNKNKKLVKLNKELNEENTKLKKEIASIKRKIPNKEWFIKKGRLESKISVYRDSIPILLTLFLAFITIQQNSNILANSHNLPWIISGVLILMTCFHCVKNYYENELAKFFKEKGIESFWWKYGSSILISLAIFVFLLWVLWKRKGYFLWLFTLLFVGSFILDVTMGRKYR